MELKHHPAGGQVRPVGLLIVPYGIETKQQKRTIPAREFTFNRTLWN